MENPCQTHVCKKKLAGQNFWPCPVLCPALPALQEQAGQGKKQKFRPEGQGRAGQAGHQGSPAL